MNIFLLGINGIGMQGLAIVAKQQGYNVSGFDDGGEIEILQKSGITYSKEIPERTDFVIFSSGIKSTHPLMLEAKAKNIKFYNRTDFWIEHIKLNDEKILIAGAHGKTTTTSMASYICDMKSYAIGGIVNGYKYAASNEEARFSVLETDESDGSFIKWQGKYKILLNFNFEHVDFYGSTENLIEHYKTFATQPEDCILVIESECKKFLNIADANNIITYGKEGSESDFIYSDIEFKHDGVNFNINGSPIFLPLLGEHNASNFTAVYAAFINAGLSHEEIGQKISQFPGVKKRMQKVREQNGFTLWLDYGHHPHEIKSTLQAILKHKKIKPHIILEPHKYSRINYTLEQWPEVFVGYKVFVTDVHSAGETPIERVRTENFIQYLSEHGIDVSHLKNIDEYELDNNTVIFSAGKLSSKF